VNIAVHHTLDTHTEDSTWNHRGQQEPAHASSELLADQFVQVRDETGDAFAITISFGYIPPLKCLPTRNSGNYQNSKKHGELGSITIQEWTRSRGYSNEREREREEAAGPPPGPWSIL
jgi:hypothetical protein